MKARSRSGSVLVQIGKVCSLGSLALFSLARLNAQAAATPSAAATNDDVVRLSPFEVTTENDRGFQSGSVGTTARMKVDLADTPVSYSIINREMIDALGIVDMGEAASWATNQTWLVTDNGGMSNNSAQQYYQRGQTVSTGTLNGTGAQRNSFQNASSINDSYNVESFDFGRGPNAALFGPGSGGGGLGGISSTQTKKARLEAPRTSISVVQGSWNYYRATVDYNRPITERFGVRINAVAQDNDGWRNREFTHTRGLTGTITWKITNTTDFTLEASHEMRQGHSVGTGFDEYISGWDGNTVFRGPITNAMLSTNGTAGAVTSGGSTVFTSNTVMGGTGLTWNGEPNGINRVAADFLVGDLHTGTLMNYRNYPITRRADSTSRVPVWSKTAPNGAYFSRFGPGSLPVQGNGSIQPAFGVGRQNQYSDNLQSLPLDMYSRVFANSKMREPSYRYTGTADTPTTWSWTKDLQTTLTQRVGNNLFLDMSADISRVHNGTQTFDQPNGATNPEGGRYVQLDINQILPDGSPNKNFLEPYSTIGQGGREDWTGDQSIRLNAVYTGLDLNKWGRYDFNFQVGSSQRDTKTRGWVVVAALNADSRRWQTTDIIRNRVNWSDPVKTYYTPTALNYTGNIDWTNPNAPVLLAASTVKPRRILGQSSGFGGTTWSDGFNRDRYYLAHTQGKFFNNAVVATLDYRRAYAYRITKSALANFGDLPVGWDAATPYFRPDAPADYFTMTYIQRNTSTGAITSTKPVLSGNRPTTTDAVTGLTVKNPFFLNERFRNDYNNPASKGYSNSKNVGVVWNVTKWAAPYVNYSTSYTPTSSSNLDINFEAIKPQDSYGYDIGTNLRFFKGNLTMRLNYYKNTRKNNTGNSPVQGQINNLYASNRFDDTDATASGRNAFGIQDLPGNGDYQDQRSDGREIEIGANMGGMRLTLNGGWGFQTSSNNWGLSKAYVPAHAADFLKILQDAGGKLDTTQKPINAPNAPGLAVADGTITGPLLDQQLAINSYNNIWINYQNMLTGTNIRTPNQPIINGLVDYTLQSGVAKGLRFGAGVRWQGTIRLGSLSNQTTLDNNTPPSAIADLSLNQNGWAYVKGSYQSTATMAYTFQLKDRRTLALNLVVTNPINDRGIVWGDGSLNPNQFANLRQPAGDLTKPNRVNRPGLISRFKEPIGYKLTATYSFGGGQRR
jgi:hypothetical protein